MNRMTRNALFGVVGMALVVAVTLSYAEHLGDQFSWMNGTKGKGNQECCGVQDCTEATVALLSQEGMGSTVMVGNTVLTIPTEWVHSSRGRTGVWCFIPQSLADGGKGPYIDAQGRTRVFPPEIPTRDNTRCVFYLSFN